MSVRVRAAMPPPPLAPGGGGGARRRGLPGGLPPRFLGTRAAHASSFAAAAGASHAAAPSAKLTDRMVLEWPPANYLASPHTT